LIDVDPVIGVGDDFEGQAAGAGEGVGALALLADDGL
jgi:hypothetical protein